MIDPTDEMVQLAVDKFLDGPSGTIGEIDGSMRDVLTAVLAIAEREWQEQYGNGFAAGFRRAEHELCPRCGVELEQGVAEERAERAARAERAVQAERAARAGRGES